MNVASLKSPLNLLQGFDVTSEDGLNNMVSVINKQFDLHFPEGFTAADYRQVIGAFRGEGADFPFAEYFSGCSLTLNAQYVSSTGGVETYDIDTWYDAIKDYLDGNMIRYAHEPGRLVTGGVVVSLRGKAVYPKDHKITFKLSLLNMGEAYRTMQSFIELFESVSLVDSILSCCRNVGLFIGRRICAICFDFWKRMV